MYDTIGTRNPLYCMWLSWRTSHLSHTILRLQELRDDVEVSLTCNTEKDRHVRLNERTAGTLYDNYIVIQYMHVHYDTILCAGILGVMWPCGVIAMLCELFVSESKSQVYAHLHDFLRMSERTAQNLSELWVKSVITFILIKCKLRKTLQCNGTYTSIEIQYIVK